MSFTLRTPQTEERYQRAMKEKREAGDTSCPLCDSRPVILETFFWKLIDNKYPYDLVSCISHLLVVKKHGKAGIFARIELTLIKYRLKKYGIYTVWLENFPKRMTIPSHYHVHLLIN